MSKIIRLRDNGNVATTGQLIENSSSFSYRNNGDIYCNELKETGEKFRILNNKDIHVSGEFIEGAVLGEVDTQLVNSSFENSITGWDTQDIQPNSSSIFSINGDWATHGVLGFKVGGTASTSGIGMGRVVIKPKTATNLTSVYKIMIDLKIDILSEGSFVGVWAGEELIWKHGHEDGFPLLKIDEQIDVSNLTGTHVLSFGISLFPKDIPSRVNTIYIDNIRLLYY